MKAKTFAKFGIGLTAAALAASTLVVPATADPAVDTYGILVGAGSDTTQDVMNGISASIGGSSDTLRIASYDAIGSEKITVRDGGNELFRANGSSNGRDLVRVAIGQITNTALTVNGTPYTWTAADVTGNIDFARSSSGAGSAAIAGGVLTYIPFALDAVTYAVAPDSVLPTLTKGSAADATVAGVGQPTLYSIYKGLVTKVVTATDTGAYVKLVDDTYVADVNETLTKINAYIPQAGSGTRSFWISQFGITEANITAATVPVTDKYSVDNLSVQEHDGSAVENDPFGITPYSIGQWVSQANGVVGVTDRRNGAVLGALSGIDATTGSGVAYALNPAFAAASTSITRKVYNIVPSALADDPTSKINWAFVGTGSLVCSQKETITRYGFGVLTGSGANACGDTSVRAYAPSISSVSVTTSVPTIKFGGSFTATATVVSNNNGGGEVEFFNGATSLGVKKIAAGATTATLDVKSGTELALADYSITAVFVPSLLGVAEATSAIAPVTVTKAVSIIRGFASSVRSTTAPVIRIAVAAPGTIPSGTVTIKEGAKTLKSATTIGADGRVSITISKLSVGTHTLRVYYAGSDRVLSSASPYFYLKVTR
jgi:hypothetical protein